MPPRAAKAGTKVIAAEGVANILSGTEKTISTETKALIATRTAQIVNNCNASDASKNKTSVCNKKSEEFQHCVAAELEHTSLINTAIDRCTKLYK